MSKIYHYYVRYIITISNISLKTIDQLHKHTKTHPGKKIKDDTVSWVSYSIVGFCVVLACIWNVVVGSLDGGGGVFFVFVWFCMFDLFYL